jgi:hypothetical protein
LILGHLDDFPKKIVFTLGSDSQDTTRRPHCLHEEGAPLDQMLAACHSRNQAYGVPSSRLQSRQRLSQGPRSGGSKQGRTNTCFDKLQKSMDIASGWSSVFTPQKPGKHTRITIAPRDLAAHKNHRLPRTSSQDLRN